MCTWLCARQRDYVPRLRCIASSLCLSVLEFVVVLCSTRQTLSPKCIGAPRLDCTAWPHSCGFICWIGRAGCAPGAVLPVRGL